MKKATAEAEGVMDVTWMWRDVITIGSDISSLAPIYTDELH